MSNVQVINRNNVVEIRQTGAQGPQGSAAYTQLADLSSFTPGSINDIFVVTNVSGSGIPQFYYDNGVSAVLIPESSQQNVSPETTAGTPVSGSKAVVTDGSGLIEVADNTNTAHFDKVLGISKTSAGAAASIDVLTSGVYTDSSLSLTPGQAIYFDNVGTLTNTVPVSGFIQRIGYALTATKILINIGTPILI